MDQIDPLLPFKMARPTGAKGQKDLWLKAAVTPERVALEPRRAIRCR